MQRSRGVVDAIEGDIAAGLRNTYLIKGVTGSGKTEVYMELIAHCIQSGRRAIVLIPEIALTYQTVMRFFCQIWEQGFDNQFKTFKW